MHSLKKKFYELIQVDERIFDFLQESSNDGIWFVNLNNIQEQWFSNSFLTALNYESTEVLKWEQLVQNPEIVFFEQYLNKNTPRGFENKISLKLKSNSEEEFLVKGKLVACSDENYKYLVGIIQKVPQQIEFPNHLEDATKKLKESEYRLQSLVKNLSIGVILHDEHTKIIAHNAKTLEFLGLTKDQLLGKTSFDPSWNVIHEDGKEFPPDTHPVSLAIQTKRPIYGVIMGVWRPIYQDRIWLQVDANPILGEDGNIVHIIVAIVNVTDRKLAERDLRRHQEIIEMASKLSGFGGWELILDDNKVYWNDTIKDVHEVERDFNPTLEQVFEFYTPESRKRLEDAVEKAIQEWTSYTMELEIVTAKGNHRMVKVIGQPEFEQGECRRLFGAFVDIHHQKQTEEELNYTKNLLEQTSKVAKLGGWEVDLVNNKVMWSIMTRKIHEVANNYMPTTETVADFYKEGEHREKILRLIDKCIKEGAPFDDEFQIITAKGREIWVRVMGKAVFDNHRCVRLFGTFQDIDDVKRTALEAQKINTRLRLATQAARIGIWEYDVVNNRLHWDEHMFALYGLKANKFTEVYEAWKSAIHPEDMERCDYEVSLALEGKKDFDTEFRVIWPNGSIRFIRALAHVYRSNDDAPSLMIGTNWDITDEKNAQEKLKEAKLQADAASKAKSEFLANMSHEIRTPLNGVIGFTDLLLQSKLNHTQQQYLSSVYQSATSLLDIINNILDFSKIEAGKVEVHVEKIDLLALSRQIIDLVKYQAHQKHLEVLLNISREVPRFVWIDEVKVRQVLVNLLSNATKFTEYGEIELKIEVIPSTTPDHYSMLRFSVRDTGIGIDLSNQKRILEAFMQEDGSTTRRFGGTGLGLSISNQLLNLLNSKLQLKSIKGEGSIFYFDMILKASSASPISETDWQNVDLIKRVLIVDDNQNNRKILKDMFALYNILSDEAVNGLEALGRLKTEKHKYDVAFVDYHMPYIDGLDTIEKIRNELNLSAEDLAIVLFHSSSESDALRIKCKALEVQQQLIKPINIEQLFSCLMRLKGSNNTSSLNIDDEVLTQDNAFYSQIIKVLIVEDNAINMDLSKAFIIGLMPQAAILEANNGLDAVEICKSQDIDLILMDIQMPEMNGYEATQKIRKLSHMESTPIIALTAGILKGERERCLAAGMNDYISKPIVKNQFIKSIKRLMGNINNNITEHFDQSALLESIGHTASVWERIKSKTIKYLDSVIPEIHQKIENQHLNEIQLLAHTLKGTSRSMYMHKLASMAERLEQAQSLQQDQMMSLVDEISSEIDYLKTIL